MSHRLKRTARAIPCAALASVVLAACGGSGADSPSSSASNDSVKFARCMREHGVQVETPTAGGPTRIAVGGNKSQAQQSMHTIEGAQRACGQYRPGAAAEAKLTPAQKVAQEEAVRKFAKCMREHGIPVETKTSTAGGGFAVRIGVGGHAGESRGETGPNPGSPAFQEAQKACQSLMPGPAGARKGGFPKGPPPPGTQGSKEAGAENKSGLALSTGG